MANGFTGSKTEGGTQKFFVRGSQVPEDIFRGFFSAGERAGTSAQRRNVLTMAAQFGQAGRTEQELLNELRRQDVGHFQNEAFQVFRDPTSVNELGFELGNFNVREEGAHAQNEFLRQAGFELDDEGGLTLYEGDSGNIANEKGDGIPTIYNPGPGGPTDPPPTSNPGPSGDDDDSGVLDDEGIDGDETDGGEETEGEEPEGWTDEQFQREIARWEEYLANPNLTPRERQIARDHLFEIRRKREAGIPITDDDENVAAINRLIENTEADPNAEPYGIPQGSSLGRSDVDIEALQSILQGFFRGELQGTPGLPGEGGAQGAALNARGTFFSQLLQGPDFSGIRGELDAVAGAVTEDLFRPGGQVEDLTSQALRATTESGFGPRSGGFDRARQNILTGARDITSREIAKQAAQLAPLALEERRQTLSGLGGLSQLETGRAESLRESLFGGQATIAQLKMAQEQQDLNRRLIEQALAEGAEGKDILSLVGSIGSGAASGALIGSSVPGIGTAAGALIGGAGGLFSGL